MADTDVQDIVTRKVGPLPLFAWAGIAGAAVLAFRRWQAARAGAAAAASGDESEPSDATGTTSTNYDTSLPSLGGVGAPSSTVQPQGGAGGDGGGFTQGKPADNDAWKAAAFSALLARGYEALSIDVALEKYLRSQTLTQDQAKLVGVALSLVGPTPSPLTLVTSVTPPPAPSKPPAGSGSQPGTGTPGAEKRAPLTLSAPLPYPWNLIRTTYGSVNAGMVSRFAAYNGLSYDGTQVKPWRAGQVVRFPAKL